MNPTEPAISAKPVFGPATAVLALAVSGRWRAPETTAALAHQSAIQARSESDIETALLAEGWLLHGLIAVGRGASGVAGAVVALEDAMRSGNEAAEARLRVGLASVARELGDLSSASILLGPVIERDIIDPEVGVDAYLEVIRCGAHPGTGEAHAAVDLAVSHIRRLRGEQVELGLAALDSVLATRHRIGGRVEAAVARAREGLRRLLGESATGSELDPISPHLAATLSLELVRSLLDDGQPELACRVAEPALAWAGRPAALVPLTRLRLVLAERAYLPAGQYDAALHAVGWAADVVGEHDLRELEADCQSLLADVHERRGALQDALTASRRAHRALRTHSARVERALVMLGRCGGGVVGRSESAPSMPQRRHVTAASAVPARAASYAPGQVDGGQGLGSGGSAVPGEVDVVASSATVRLRSVKLQPSPASSQGGSAEGSWTRGTDFGRPDTGHTEPPGSVIREPRADGGRRVGDAVSGFDASARWEPAGAPWSTDDRDARPAAAMASGSLDDWAAITGWRGDTAESADLAGSSSPRAARAEVHPPEGVGAISAEAAERHRWTDAVPHTGAFGPDRRVHPSHVLDTGGAGGDIDDGTSEEQEPEPDELADLFDPGEQRPLGLVAIDVATPRGPLTGDRAKPLLAHIADQARSQLPANARLQVLSSDTVLVVLPPVEPDAVLRWMRSLATRLAAGWTEVAADDPRSAYRVATGAFDAELSVEDNVGQLIAQLAGTARQPATDSPPGGGRHVARRGSPPSPGRRPARRTNAESGSGGRRRRPDGDDAPGSAVVPVTPSTNDAVSHVAADTGNPPEGRASGPFPGEQRAESSAGTARQYPRGRGIDRVALARLTQMGWGPSMPIAREIEDLPGDVPDAVQQNGAALPRPHRAAAAGVEVHATARVADTLLVGNGPGTGAANGDRPSVSGAARHQAANTGMDTGMDTGMNNGAGIGNGACRNGVGSPAEPEIDVAAPVRADPVGATRSDTKGTVRHADGAPVAELSFAELLAGALAAYRDG